ncbi:MAG: sigma-54-dependent transcriptional regulator [Myxococcales bacterium]
MELIGTCEEMTRVRNLLPRVAAGDSSVLLVGEAGTGREFLARRIHEGSRRADRPFEAVVCGALAGDASELFGDAARPGVLQRCAGGTVYLADIEQLPAQVQAQLARWVDACAQGEIEAPPRLLASARRPLPPLIARGRFRGDLFYRLSVVTIRLPALRDRREDVTLFARHFLDLSARMLGKRFDGISAPALELLRRHRWEGNLNELSAAMERAAVIESGRVLTVSSLPPAIASLAAEPLSVAS